MTFRRTLLLASTAAAASLGLIACGDDSSTPNNDSGVISYSGSTSGSGSGSTTGSSTGSGTTTGSMSGSASGSGSTSGTGTMDATTDAPGPDAAADATTGDAGSGDATTTSDTGAADVASGDTTTADVATDTGSAEASAEAGVSDAATDGATDAATDAIVEAGDHMGPACGNTLCNSGQHCCGSAATRVLTCQAACDPDAGTFPLDCAGSTDDPDAGVLGQCGTGKQCCGQLVLTGAGTSPNCTAAGLASSCVPSGYCPDTPPQNCTAGQYTLRLCTASADCADDIKWFINDAGMEAGVDLTYCCSFGAADAGASPYWCVNKLGQISATSCLP